MATKKNKNGVFFKIKMAYFYKKFNMVALKKNKISKCPIILGGSFTHEIILGEFGKGLSGAIFCTLL